MSADLASTVPSSPEWLPHRYDPGHDAVHFVKVDRKTRASVPFLTDENLAGVGEPIVLARDESMLLASAPSPIHFVFHSAYCCSTLLANAWDRPGRASSLKEPVILNDLIGWLHRGASQDEVTKALNSVLGLLACPFEPGEAMVVKPSNVVNGLAESILQMRPSARCLLLYAPLDAYLASIAGKGLWGRLWVRDLLLKQLRQNLVHLGFEPQDFFLQSDLQVAAVGWLAQHQLFTRLAQKWPDRVRTLNSEVLLARPEESLKAMSDLFAVSLGDPEIEEIKTSTFKQHAKFGGEFDRESRESSRKKAADLYADELSKVSTWARSVAEAAGLDMTAPLPLIT